MTVLHITNWYPSRPTPDAAPWIKAQIDALPEEVTNVVYHIEVNRGKLDMQKGKNPDGSFYIILSLPFVIWTLTEWLSFWMVLWVFFNMRRKQVDIVNFHIAYPNAVFVKKLKKWVNSPFLITEHWSAYHFNFNVPNPDRLKKIKKIFHNRIPVIGVSKALIEDIKKFSETDFPSHVLPNVVDATIFNFKKGIEPDDPYFLMISHWKWPKDPFTVLKAWKEISKKYPEITLRIGGYGPQWEPMVDLVQSEALNNITFLGKLTPTEVAEEMRNAEALIHCSEYETFSVVCAEALCCGTPVIASEVGGINEFIHENNGILVEDNKLESWVTAICEGSMTYNREAISKKAQSMFTSEVIGDAYFNLLKNLPA